LTISDLLKPYFYSKDDKYLNDPKYDFDKYILERKKVLNISTKKLVIERIKFMVEQLKKNKIKYLIDFIIRNKKVKLSVFQLKMLLNKPMLE